MKAQIHFQGLQISKMAAQAAGWTGRSDTGLTLADVKERFKDRMMKAFHEYHEELESNWEKHVANSLRRKAEEELRESIARAKERGVEIESVVKAATTENDPDEDVD